MGHDLLTLDEVAAYTRAPLNSVRYWITTGKLRSIRPGRRRLVRRQDLEHFLDGGADPGACDPAMRGR